MNNYSGNTVRGPPIYIDDGLQKNVSNKKLLINLSKGKLQ